MLCRNDTGVAKSALIPDRVNKVKDVMAEALIFYVVREDA